MKRILYSLSAFLLAFLASVVDTPLMAQTTNYARTATATCSDPWNWNRINDGNINSCNSGQEAFVWTSGGRPTGWMQWTWSSNVTINQFKIYHAQTNSRYLAGGTIQKWNGSSWVTHDSWSTTSYNCVTTVDFATLTSDRIRITNFAYGPNQQSNPNFMEIEIYVTTLGTNNAGIGSIADLNPCTPTQNIMATLTNMGTNRLDSVDVMYQINGGTVNTVKYNSGSSFSQADTISSAGEKRITLASNYTFTPNTTYNIVVWTHLPNGVSDTVNFNDTMSYTFDYLGVPSKPTVADQEQCGTGFPTLVGTSPAGAEILWFEENDSLRVVGIGDTATLNKRYSGEKRYKFTTRSMSNSADTIVDDFDDTWSYTGGASPQDKGYFWDVRASHNVVIGNLHAALSALGGPLNDITVELYIKSGTYTGSETNSSAWTLWGSDVINSTTTGDGDSVLIELPYIYLEGGNLYGFYLMVKDVPQSFRTNCSRSASGPSGLGLDIVKGSLSAGTFSNIAFTGGFVPEIGFDYLFGCVSDTVNMNLDVWKLPVGANLVQGSTFEGQYNRGNMNDPDIVAEDSMVVYELQPATDYPNSTFGTDWVVTDLSLTTINGAPISSSDTSTTPITTTSNGTLTFTPSSGWADSTIRVSVTIQELAHGCDTVIERYIFVAPTGVPDFEFKNGCLGTPIQFVNNSTVSSGFLTYNWDFGDGNTSDFEEPIHNYQNYGKFKVTLEVITDLGIRTSITKEVEVFEIPVVKFTVKNNCEGQAVEFTNQTTISSGTIDYLWDFGDGKTSQLESPSHLYDKPGGYNVNLLAIANGCRNSLSKNANQFATPTADFSVEGACSGVPVNITNNSSIELGEPIGSFWDMGDGEVNTDFNPEYSYSSSGDYTIKYKAISQFGCSDSIERSVTIKQGPVADFSWDRACNIDPVNFTNETTEPTGANTIYSWDFGDGNTSTATNPSNQYPRLGEKHVTLTASSDNGCSDMITKSLRVLVQPVANFSVQDACAGESAIFVNTTKASGAATYKWYFGDGDSSDLNSPTHVYTPVQSETYNVRLLASVVDGCTDEIAKSVNIKEQPICSFTAEQSSENRNTWTFTPDNNSYGDAAYTWVLKGSRTYNTTSPTHTFEYSESEYRVILSIMTTEGCQCIDSSTYINTSWALGTTDLNEIGVSIYPNPSSGQVFLQASEDALNFNVDVIDMNGRQVFKQEEIAVTRQGAKIDLAHLANGVYQVRLSNDKVQAIQKLVIQH